MSNSTSNFVDNFLYFCHEEERTQVAKFGSIDQKLRWPTLSDNPDSVPVELEDFSFEDGLGDMIAWYRTTYPEVNSKNIADPENLRVAVPVIVALRADIDHWTKLSFKGTPNFDNDADPFWTSFNTVLGNYLSEQKDLYKRYFHWCWAEEKNEEFIPGSRPPVGKYAPRQRRDRNGNKFDKEGGGRPRREKVQMHKRKRRHNKEKTAELEQQAKRAVEDAVEKIKGGEAEVALKPTNSYYRRIQHSFTKDLGFNSTSRGEGNDRAVVITK